jgi:hypothetical protein
MGFIPTSTLVCALSVFGFRPGIVAAGNLDTANPATASAEPGRDHAAYARALQALDDALLVANTDPEQGIPALNRALDALHQFAPLLAVDEEARMQRSLAHLALARAKLARGDEQGAAESVDSTLRELGELELPVEQLGPTLGKLFKARRSALATLGEARLRVSCATACTVWIDERSADQALMSEGQSLIPGSHRVWIEDPSGSLEPLRTSVELRADDPPLELSYPAANVPHPQLLDGSRQSNFDRARNRNNRLAPRWAEVLTTSMGVAVLAAGATLWALNNKCPGGHDPHDTVACPQLYDTRTAGIASVTIGGTILVTGVVMLTVDELRQRRRARESAGVRIEPLGLHPQSPPLGLRF